MLSRSELSAIGGASIATFAGTAWFWAHPPMHVLVGSETIDALVPVHYQASAFPAFGAMVAAVLLALWERRAERRDRVRAALLLSCSIVAAARLLVTIPLSGHVVFLTAALVFERWLHVSKRVPFAWLLACAGIVVTAWYKLAVWDDYAWFAMSGVVGVAMGGAGATLLARSP
jgi:hypothetical protein